MTKKQRHLGELLYKAGLVKKEVLIKPLKLPRAAINVLDRF